MDITSIIAVIISISPMIIIFYMINRSQEMALQAQDTEIPVQAKRSLSQQIYWIVAYIIVILLLLVFLLQEIMLNQYMVGSLALLSFLLFFLPVRQWLSQWMPFDPHNQIHTISLVLSTLIFVQLFSLTSQGLENIINDGPTDALTSIIELWTQDLLLFFLGLIGVGWLTRRNFSDTLRRLGLIRLSWKNVFMGIGIAVLLVIFAIGVEYLFTLLGWGVDPEVERITEEFLAPLYNSIPGILTLGLAAAIGEETIFRGALLPRFGLIYSSLLFAALHTNYGLTVATLIVFVIGLLLGWLRTRYSTTLTMVVHAAYNIILGTLAYLGLQ